MNFARKDPVLVAIDRMTDAQKQAFVEAMAREADLIMLEARQ